LETGFSNTLNDVVDLGCGGVVGHIHNHGDDLSFFAAKKQKPRFYRGFGGIYELSLLTG
jgi:hypothetical protein